MLHNIVFYCHICNNLRLYSVKELSPSDLFEINRAFYEN